MRRKWYLPDYGAEIGKCFDHSESIEVFSPTEKNYLKSIPVVKREVINLSLKRPLVTRKVEISIRSLFITCPYQVEIIHQKQTRWLKALTFDKWYQNKQKAEVRCDCQLFDIHFSDCSWIAYLCHLASFWVTSLFFGMWSGNVDLF